MNDNKIVEKILKLLALGESPNENEASLALEKALELMDMHNIRQQDLNLPSSIGSADYLSAGRIPTWVKILANSVGKLTGCKPLIHSRNGVKVIRSWGKEENLTVFTHTMDYLVEVCDRLTIENGYGKGRAYCTQYRNGLVMRIGQRINQMMMPENSTEKALVLRSNAIREIEDFFQKTGYKVKTQVLDVESAGGYHHGYKDGGKVNLSKQLKS